MSEDRYCLVRGRATGFVRVWDEELIPLLPEPMYEILGRDLSEEEAIALARITNIDIRHRLGESDE